ncbi:cobalamin B12-binding domain-containing protein [Streptomyces sp. NPDC048337]|uniref:cobalamin B12-binding domain-containing protein n=1 Tax=Streptomyces sp. NPDC048337 TaxID=3365535 RepID=UPI0037198335
MTLDRPPQDIPATAERKRRVLVSSTSSDSHTWNLVFLQILLEEMGHDVVNVGACVPDELLISECERVQPDMVVISSVNGHGFLDGRRLISRLRRTESVSGLPVVIGGKLGTRGSEGEGFGAALMDAGFDAVFEDGEGIGAFRDYLAMTGAPRILETAS